MPQDIFYLFFKIFTARYLFLDVNFLTFKRRCFVVVNNPWASFLKTACFVVSARLWHIHAMWNKERVFSIHICHYSRQCNHFLTSFLTYFVNMGIKSQLIIYFETSNFSQVLFFIGLFSTLTTFPHFWLLSSGIYQDSLWDSKNI